MSQPFKVTDSADFERLWRAQKGLCALCGRPMLRSRFEAPHARVWAKWRATYDHILPRSKGGTDDPSNLQLTHAVCNKIKGSQTDFKMKQKRPE
ncbi:MAG: HNH endonuclease signature motif containing protein [Pseudomonadota bacterium]